MSRKSKPPVPELRVPHPGEGKRGPSGHIGYLLRQAHAVHRLRMDHALADLELTPPQFAVLTMLRAYPGISNADLARLSFLTPQTVCVIVANLEKRGAVARRPHAIHGRIQHLDVTSTGQHLLAAARERVQKIERWLLDGLPPTQERAIRNWLAGLASRHETKL
jgi:DNA-binding MarR family transcriptional regulator